MSKVMSPNVEKYIQLTRQFVEAPEDLYTPEQTEALVEEGEKFFKSMTPEEQVEARDFLLAYLQHLMFDDLNDIEELTTGGLTPPTGTDIN